MLINTLLLTIIYNLSAFSLLAQAPIVRFWDQALGGDDKLISHTIPSKGGSLLEEDSVYYTEDDKAEPSNRRGFHWKVKVNFSSPQIIEQPINKIIKGGKSTNFYIAASEANLKYQWQVSVDSGTSFKNISNSYVYSGATTASLHLSQVPISMSGYQYRAVVSNESVIISDVATLTVNVPDFDNTHRAWQLTGSMGFSAGSADFTALTLDNNNVPYLAYKDNANREKLTVMKYNNTKWVDVGAPGFSTDQLTTVYNHVSIAVTPNGVPLVAFYENGNGISYSGGSFHTAVMGFNGANWTASDYDFPGDWAFYPNLALDKNGVPHVVVRWRGDPPEGRGVVMKFEGNRWVMVSGSETCCYYLSDQGLFEPKLAFDTQNKVYVVYRDVANSSKATVERFNNGYWEVVGTKGISPSSASNPSISLDTNGTPYIVYNDGAYGGKATVMRFNGTDWVVVGSAGLSVGGASSPSLALDVSGTPYVAYSDRANGGKATVMRFSGTDWVAVGSAGLSVGSVSSPSFVLDSRDTPYIAYSDGANGEKATVMKFSDVIPLPVTWLTFNGVEEEQGNELTWSTASEMNTDSFIVERSSDGETFVEISKVMASGNSSIVRQYSFLDTDLPVGSITLYYRLKQLDLDGKSEYSKVIAVSGKGKQNNLQLSAFPNPFDQTLTLRSPSLVNSRSGQVWITGADGREMYQKDISYLLGSSSLVLQDLPELSRGVYLLRVLIDGEVSTHKLIKI